MATFAGEFADLIDVVRVGLGVEDVVRSLGFGFFEGFGRKIDTNNLEAVGLEVLNT